MSDSYYYDLTIKQSDHREAALAKGSYEACVFESCNFESSDLAHIKFTDCEFIDCNLTLANISDTIFQDITFHGCKMLGLHFEHCNSFGFSVEFKKCILNDSTFYQRSLQKTIFDSCELKHIDFGEADLTEARFHDCDLTGALFENTHLNGANLQTAYNFIINPENNSLNKTVFAKEGLGGLLSHLNIVIK